MPLWFRRAVIWLFLLLPFLPSIIVMSLHFDPNQAECYGIVSLILHSIQSSFNRTSTYQPYIDVSCSSGDGTDVPGLDVESAFDDVGEERISLYNSGKSELSYSPPGNSFSFTPVPTHFLSSHHSLFQHPILQLGRFHWFALSFSPT